MSSEDDSDFTPDENESDNITESETSDEYEPGIESKRRRVTITTKSEDKSLLKPEEKFQLLTHIKSERNILSSLPSHAEWRTVQTYKGFTDWKQIQSKDKDGDISKEMFTRYLKSISKTKGSGGLEKHFSYLKKAALKEHGIDLGDLSDHLAKPDGRTEEKDIVKNKSMKRHFKTESNDDRVKTKRKRKTLKEYKETSESETETENKKDSKLQCKTFTAEDVEGFLHEASDFYNLSRKVLLIFGIHGGCTFKQLRRITVHDVRTQPDKSLIVNVRSLDTIIIRTFTIRDEHLKIVHKYMSLRPKMNSDKFFYTFINGRCTKTAIGYDYIAAVPRKVAKFLKLPNPEMYKRDCFEASSKVILNCGRDSCFNKPWMKGSGHDSQDEPLIRRYAEWSSSEQSEHDEKNSKNLTTNTKIAYHRELNRVYRAFMDWKQRKGEENFTEKLFLEYFRKMTETPNGSSPNYLKSEFDKLKAMVKQKHGIDFNKFEELIEFHRNTVNSLVGKFTGRVVKRFTAGHVDTFLRDAPDEEYLVAKVILIFEINGGSYLQEIQRASINDVHINTDDSITVNLRNNKSATSVTFCLRDEHANIVRKYMSLRPTHLDTDKFFISYNKGKFGDCAIGKHQIYRNSKVVAAYLNLPDSEKYVQRFRRPAKRKRTTKPATATYKDSKHMLKDSQDRYNRWYNDFMDFKFDKGEENFTERIFIDYFKKCAENKTPNYVLIIYSMIKTMIKKEHDVDLNEFEELRSFIRDNKSRVDIIGAKVPTKLFTPENVETFLNDAPDDEYILMKVVLIFGINSGCLIKEFKRLSVNDVKVQSETCVTFRARDSNTNVIKTFYIRGDHAKIVNKYISQRPTDLDNDKFFIRNDTICKNNKRRFSNRPLNKQHICVMGRKVAGYLKLPNPEQYLGLAMSHPSYRKRESQSHFVEEYVFDLDNFNQDREDASVNDLKDDVENNKLGNFSVVKDEALSIANDDIEVFNTNYYYENRYSDPKPSTSYEASQSNENKFINIDTSSLDLNAPDPLNDIDDDDGYDDYIADDDCSKANVESETANQNVKETIISLPNKIVKIMFINCENVSNITINLPKRQL